MKDFHGLRKIYLESVQKSFERIDCHLDKLSPLYEKRDYFSAGTLSEMEKISLEYAILFNEKQIIREQEDISHYEREIDKINFRAVRKLL